MNNEAPRMSPERIERVRRMEGVKCYACYRKILEGEPWYEMHDGSIVCKKDMMESSMRCAHKGEV